MPRLFGDKVRGLRRQHGLTQVELAEQLGLAGHAHVGKLEAGQDAPSLDLALRLVRVFRVSIDYLLRDTLPVADLSPPVARSAGEGVQPQPFGTKLRALRQAQGWSQRDLAQHLGLTSRAYISNLEASRKLPSIDFVVQLADLFGVTTDELLQDDIPISGANG